MNLPKRESDIVAVTAVEMPLKMHKKKKKKLSRSKTHVFAKPYAKPSPMKKSSNRNGSKLAVSVRKIPKHHLKKHDSNIDAIDESDSVAKTSPASSSDAPESLPVAAAQESDSSTSPISCTEHKNEDSQNPSLSENKASQSGSDDSDMDTPTQEFSGEENSDDDDDSPTQKLSEDKIESEGVGASTSEKVTPDVSEKSPKVSKSGQERADVDELSDKESEHNDNNKDDLSKPIEEFRADSKERDDESDPSGDEADVEHDHDSNMDVDVDKGGRDSDAEGAAEESDEGPEDVEDAEEDSSDKTDNPTGKEKRRVGRPRKGMEKKRPRVDSVVDAPRKQPRRSVKNKPIAPAEKYAVASKEKRKRGRPRNTASGGGKRKKAKTSSSVDKAKRPVGRPKKSSTDSTLAKKTNASRRTLECSCSVLRTKEQNMRKALIQKMFPYGPQPRAFVDLNKRGLQDWSSAPFVLIGCEMCISMHHICPMCSSYTKGLKEFISAYVRQKEKLDRQGIDANEAQSPKEKRGRPRKDPFTAVDESVINSIVTERESRDARQTEDHEKEMLVCTQKAFLNGPGKRAIGMLSEEGSKEWNNFPFVALGCELCINLGDICYQCKASGTLFKGFLKRVPKEMIRNEIPPFASS